MDPKHAQQLLKKTKEDYKKIAPHFLRTRENPRPEMKYFVKKYVKSRQKILDVGCGNGHIFELLKDKKVDYTGLDNIKFLIFEGRRKYSPLGAKFIVQDALKLKFRKEKFDLIFAFAFLHHIPSEKLRQKFLAGVYKILKPKGYFICTVWNLFSRERIEYIEKYNIQRLLSRTELDFDDTFIPWKDSQGKVLAERYYHGFTRPELEKLFKAKNFKILELFYEKNGKKSEVNEADNLCIAVQK